MGSGLKGQRRLKFIKQTEKKKPTLNKMTIETKESQTFKSCCIVSQKVRLLSLVRMQLFIYLFFALFWMGDLHASRGSGRVEIL